MRKTAEVAVYRVSVIIPCFRCGGTINRAVMSALVQSAPPLEIIVVDDASRDDTDQVLESLRRAYGGRGLRIVSLERNCGAAAARNAGWEAAVGDFIAFLDADDTWHPRKLELQLEFMRVHPQFPMTAHLLSFNEEAPIDSSRVPYTEISFRSMLYRNWFHTSSVVMRREVTQRFVPSKRYGEDRQLWLDVASAGRHIARIELPLVTVYKPLYGASGLSADLWRMELAELETFIDLRKSGRIGVPLMFGLLAWSLIRFARRLVVVLARRFRGGDRSCG